MHYSITQKCFAHDLDETHDKVFKAEYSTFGAEISFFNSVGFTKLKEPSRSYYLPIICVRDEMDSSGFELVSQIPFPTKISVTLNIKRNRKGIKLF